jgi:hypothetical protein
MDYLDQRKSKMSCINLGICFFRVLILSFLLTVFVEAQSVSASTTKSTNQIKTSAQLERLWNKLYKEQLNEYAIRVYPGFLKADKKTQADVIGKMDKVSIKINILDELLSQATENVINESVRKFYLEKDNTDHFSDYEFTLHVALTDRFLNRSDDESLVEILSYVCPVGIAYTSTELYIAVKSFDKISLLFDVYENSSGRNQARVLKILQDVFADQCDECRKTVIRRMDAEFIKVSREWFEANKNQLTYNPWYKRMADYGSDQYGLFRPKESLPK